MKELSTQETFQIDRQSASILLVVWDDNDKMNTVISNIPFQQNFTPFPIIPSNVPLRCKIFSSIFDLSIFLFWHMQQTTDTGDVGSGGQVFYWYSNRVIWFICQTFPTPADCMVQSQIWDSLIPRSPEIRIWLE